MTNPCLVYIAGSGHSGSTLLDMMLGGHQQISSLGEVHRLYVNAQNTSGIHRCTCSKTVYECSFWSRVAEGLQDRLGVRDPEIFLRLPTTDPAYARLKQDGEYLEQAVKPRAYYPSLSRAAMVLGSRTVWQLLARFSNDVRLNRVAVLNSLILFEVVRHVWGTPIIIDSTKNPARMKGLYLAAKEPVIIFNLIRDGRAVCHSRMIRQGLPMEQCALLWRAEHRKRRLTQMSMPRHILHTLHYERLCRSPQEELQRVCQVLRLDYQPAMLQFRDRSHNLGGNPMRFRTDERENSVE